MEQQNILQEEALKTVREGLMAGKRISFPFGIEVKDDEIMVYSDVTMKQVVEERQRLNDLGLLPH